MDLNTLQIFKAVADERSFSRAAVQLGRTQPAISLAVQRLEHELGEPLVDRSTRKLTLTDAGRMVHDYARQFDNLTESMAVSLSELRDHHAGQLIVGANESTALYLLGHIATYRQRYPRVRILVRRSLSSKIPNEILEGDLELGVVSYQPADERITSREIYRDHLAFVVSPQHRLAKKKSVVIGDLGMETFIAHNVISPYRERVVSEFQRRNVPLNREIEMPTIETIKKLVQQNQGVAFLPHMCVAPEIAQGQLNEVPVSDLHIERKIYLVFPAQRRLSHAARAFLGLL
ncbi:MAG: LysR family transcriptional regulator [Deltaproteobacteria bacterium]|nr:LysR family transcriptional regulator [Deltaproteobacteria bacterium]